MRFRPICLVAFSLASPAFANDPPLAPAITEPVTEGVIVNPADVHMEVAGFVDPNPLDTHLCSDWEIWSVTPSERVWSAHCVTGPESVHVHLGDGAFEGSLAGAGALAENTSYVMWTRHRDSSGDPATEWGPWSTRGFKTGLAQAWFALELEDVEDLPAPTWRIASDGSAVDLPAGAAMVLETGTLASLLSVDGLAGADLWINPPALPSHAPVRARITAGPGGLSLTESDLVIFEHGCVRHALLLPAIALGAGQEWVVWFSSEGLPFIGFAWQTTPVFGTPMRNFDPPWIAEQAGFVVETVATGFQLAVDVAFVPSPGPASDDVLFYVSELYGTIRTVARDGSLGTFASGLLDFSPTGAFPGSGEQGLTGLAVDPATGDVFAAMLHDGGGGVHYPKVVRFQSTDGGKTAASATTILDFVGESQGQSHQISNLQMWGDGTLLVHMGDGFFSAAAQDPHSYRGKILRAKLDGSAPTDNPFYDAGDGIDALDYTWALGVRNPFGGDKREADGLQYEVENGPSTDRFVRVMPGMNVGWDGSNPSMFTNAIYVWNPAKAPVDLAFAQASSFAGGAFPAAKMGHAFVSLSGATYSTGPQSGAKRIAEFTLDAAGDVVGAPLVLARYAGGGKSTITGLAFGPDGLYFSTLYPDAASAGPTGIGGSLLRVRFDPGADCNQNGVLDVCDVAYGTSADCNDDGVPDECSLPAEIVRAGEPPNPLALLPGVTTAPTLGALWDPMVDHATFAPTAVLDVLAIGAGPANLPSPLGTILCTLTPPPALVQAVPGNAFAVLIPPACAYLGASVATQAGSVTAVGEIALTNALDVTIGF